jgi:hypothetical protein
VTRDNEGEAKMPALETVKKFAEKLTGWARPSKADLMALVKERKAHSFRFQDDGTIPCPTSWGGRRLPTL